MEEEIALVPEAQPKTSSFGEWLRKENEKESSRDEVVIANKSPSTPQGESSVAGSLPYEILDLALDTVESSELCRRTMKFLMSAKRVIVLAGAGISVAAGIPDFRSSVGLFSTLKADTKYKPSGKELFDVSVYKVFFLYRTLRLTF